MRWPPQTYDWPLAEYSRQIRSAGHLWHVQVLGEGPTVLLLHGAGGGGQSWRDVAPLLARKRRVIVPDLTGQGFTRPGRPNRFGLDEMTADIETLIGDQEWDVSAVIGHSAGAAIALRLAQLGHADKVVLINPALGTFEGPAEWLFPAMARTMALSPFTANIFSGFAGHRETVRRLLQATGSKLTPEIITGYLKLIRDRDHVAGTLNMMANWDLRSVLEDLPHTKAQVLVLIGENDQTVPPRVGLQAASKLPNVQTEVLPGLGHLAHEEAPDLVVQKIETFLDMS